jgi:TRAP-type C4-dicarboxylate transport system substrate-binding protein
VRVYPFAAQVLFCREPVKSLDDIKGKKVRTHGGSLNDFIQAVGGQPVASASRKSTRRWSAAWSIAR